MSLRIPYFRRGAKNTAKGERLSPSERHKKTKKHQTLPEGATLTTQHTSTQLDYSSFYDRRWNGRTIPETSRERLENCILSEEAGETHCQYLRGETATYKGSGKDI